MTSCMDEDEPRDKTKDIIMSVSEETGIMYDLFDDKREHPIECFRVMDEDFPGEWRNLALNAIQGFDYEPGHRYTLKRTLHYPCKSSGRCKFIHLSSS